MNNNIIRCSTGSNFTMISNVGLRDTRLSFKARGILAYLIGLPTDWKVSITDLENRGTDKRQSISTGINELIKFGYCIKENIRENGLFAGVVYKVCDEPVFLGEKAENSVTSTFKPKADFPKAEKPKAENQQLQRNNKQRNNIQRESVLNFDDDKFANYNKNMKTLFANCPLSDDKLFNDLFVSKHKELVDLNIDLYYYRNAVSRWSDKSDTKRTFRGWIATIVDFISSDKQKGKLVLTTKKDNTIQNIEAIINKDSLR